MHRVLMSENELNKLETLQLVNAGKLSRREASERLDISLRQVDRLRQTIKMLGPKGIIHGNCGKKSNRVLKESLKQEVVFLLKERYFGFGPTFAAEKLLELDNIRISKEKLRRLMIEEGLWKRQQRTSKEYHPRRPRRSHFGDLLQGDGSHHNWFEERGGRCVLVALIDDATNISYGRFYDGETIESYVSTTRRYFQKYGRFRSLYVDRDSIFRVNKPGAANSTGDTQFGRMMKELDINLICAHSPQAKGRVERLFGTLQDRLVKEMRLKGISNIEEANEYLEESFWDEFNERWSFQPKHPENYHREVHPEDILDRAFTLRDTRSVSKSLDFSYCGKMYQIISKTPNRLMNKRITILERFDGTFWVEYDEKKLDVQLLKDMPRETPVEDAKTINSYLDKKKPLTIIERHRRGIGCLT